jgi:uncharacterized protein (TIGR04255 family)
MPEPTDTPFPTSPRVIYGKSPLTQVICQVRFPTILKIEAELPSAFQERIRQAFPLFERASPVTDGALQIPEGVAQLIARQIKGQGYRFLSEDRSAFIGLDPSSMSLSTTHYTRWEDFLGALEPALDALLTEYTPSFFARIGLRYTDTIVRSKIGLANARWSELLNNQILGELANPAIEENVSMMQKAIQVRNTDRSGGVVLQQSLAVVQGTSEIGYTVDFDFYRDQKTKVDDARAILDRLHQSAGSAFRWCITERLHNALEPRRI